MLSIFISGGTDFSPLWHKKVDDSVVCAACHVKSKCKENEGKAQASYNEYLGRYKLVLAGVSIRNYCM